MKKVITYFLLVLFLSYSGCATIFSGSKEEVEFLSEPSGAKVLINGVDEGSTPMKISLKKGREYIIEFTKEGYHRKTLRMSYSLGIGWLVLDIVAGLIGVVVDAVSGNWNNFDLNSYKAILEK